MSLTEFDYESRTRPAPIEPSPLWMLVGFILALAAGPGLVLLWIALEPFQSFWTGNPTVDQVVRWLALIIGIASVVLPIVLFTRGIFLTVRRRSPLGYGLGIGLLIGIGVDLILVVAIGWYFYHHLPFFPG